jgi:hypothetical protein
MKKRQRPEVPPLACRIALRVQPVRALALTDEQALAQAIEHLVAARGWYWEGTHLAGWPCWRDISSSCCSRAG